MRILLQRSVHAQMTTQNAGVVVGTAIKQNIGISGLKLPSDSRESNLGAELAPWMVG